MFSLQKFSPRNFDWLLITVVCLLVAMGLAAIYSVDLSRGSELIYFKKQTLALAVGLIVLFGASAAQFNFFKTYAKWWYLLSIILLVMVLILGKNIRGTTGWFVFGNFSFQPVEFAKVGLILMLAYISAGFGRRFDNPIFFIGSGIIAAILIGLIMLQPDLGSAFLVGLIWLGFMLLTGVKKSYLIWLVVGLILISIGAWFLFLQGYQKDRLLSFVDPGRDPLGSGYNVIQSTIAVGSGRWTGRGLGFGSQSQLRFLPETQTDFVFSVIGEELGLAGVSVMLCLFALLFWRLILITKRTNNDFISMTVSGIIILFFAQFFINVGANIGLVPVTGVTLPFVSYGGSSLVINLLLIGIVESMLRKKY